MKVKVIEANSVVHHHQVWKSSLEPFWKWMKFIGMSPTDTFDEPSYIKSIHRWALYLAVLIVQPSIVIHLLCNTEIIVSTYTKGDYSSALHWNFLIDVFNYAIYVVGVYTAFNFMIGRGFWKSLKDSIDLIEINLPFSTQNQQLGRKCSILAVTYLILSILTLGITLGTELFTNGSSLTRKILDLCGLFTRMFPVTVIVLFCLIAFILSMKLRSISSRLKTDPTIDEKTLTLLKWQHILICRAVDKMNQNFGFALLLEVIFSFVGTTNNLMFILASGSKKDWHMTVSSTLFCVDQILQLFVITIAADGIINENRNIYMALMELFHRKSTLKIEATYFADQVLHMSPHIEAAGFVTIGKSLFPSCIGMILTYFFIFLQFHSAEQIDCETN